ncbi:MAG: HEPN domain-containing protein [Candidatus Nanoarchaeia archaeon]
MKRFLLKLKKENKIQIVEPSEDICKSYLQKSEKSKRSAKATYEIESYEDSVALTYYSMYYSVLALLFRTGVKCENHTAAAMLLKQIFDIDNKDIEQAKAQRIDKQYYVDFSVTKEEVKNAIRTAEDFNTKIFNFIDSLSNKDVDYYRKKTQSLLNP